MMVTSSPKPCSLLVTAKIYPHDSTLPKAMLLSKAQRCPSETVLEMAN